MRQIATTFAALSSIAVFAQYPNKNINYFIPFPAGGESYVAARQQGIIRKKLAGTDFIVLSKPCAGGALVCSTLNYEPSDGGYTAAGVDLPHIVLRPMEGNVRYKTGDGPFERVPAFMEDRKKAHTESAKLMGLTK